MTDMTAKHKYVWFEDSKGFMRELPADTPARYQGKMFPLGDAQVFNDIEVHDTRWIPGTRVDPPRTMVVEVRLTVRDHLAPKDAVRQVSDILRARGDVSDDIISFEVKATGA